MLVDERVFAQGPITGRKTREGTRLAQGSRWEGRSQWDGWVDGRAESKKEEAVYSKGTDKSTTDKSTTVQVHTQLL